MSIESYPNPNGVLTSLIWRKTMSGAETSLSGYDNASQALSYTPGQEQVYLNGILLVRGDDYTATNGTSITGLAALSASDYIQVNCYNNFSVASVPAQNITGTVTNAQLANSAITINGSAISLGGTVTLAGDIESVTAGTGLTGGGNSGAVTLSLDTTSVISPTIVNAKGDILTASADNVPAILSLGNNGETLISDSSTSTGLRYTAGNPIPNPIINSCFDIWQRGTTATIATTTYAADRWIAFRGGYAAGMTVSRQLVNDSTNLPNIQYCARVQRDSGNTSTQGLNIQYWQETSNSVPLTGKTVTFSFYARAGANYSSASGNLIFQLNTGTGTDQNGALVAYTGAAQPINTPCVLTTTWQRFSATATLATNTNEYGVLFINTPVGTAGANDYYEVTGVQIDIGSVALPIRRNGATIQGELAACQRYFIVTQLVAGSSVSTAAVSASGGNLACIFTNPVSMRTVPSITTNLTNANYGILWALDVAYVLGSVAKTGTVAINVDGRINNTNIFFTGATWASTPNIFYPISTGYIYSSAEL